MPIPHPCEPSANRRNQIELSRTPNLSCVFGCHVSPQKGTRQATLATNPILADDYLLNVASEGAL